MTIELKPEIEARLRETAAREGLSVEDYLSAVVGRAAPEPEPTGHAAPGPDRTASEHRHSPDLTTSAGLAEYSKQIGAGGTPPGSPDVAEIVRQMWEEEEAIRNEPVLTNPAEILEYWKQTGVFESAPSGPDSPELARQWREEAAEERQRRLFHTS